MDLVILNLNIEEISDRRYSIGCWRELFCYGPRIVFVPYRAQVRRRHQKRLGIKRKTDRVTHVMEPMIPTKLTESMPILD